MTALFESIKRKLSSLQLAAELGARRAGAGDPH